MDLQLNDRVALVTGGSRGIGRSIARQLAREGARLILVARSPEQLEAVRQEIAGPGKSHHAYAIDLMAADGVARLIDAIRTDLGALDIIVHNLGGSLGVSSPFAPAEDWQKVWFYNVGIGHEINRAFIPDMVKQRWGRVVHVSTLSTTPPLGYAAYVAAKCTLDSYVKVMSREVSKDNVILSAVSPGAIYSEGRHFDRMLKENPAWMEEFYNHHLPSRRLGTAEDVAGVVAFLCSDRASFLAGSNVDVGGGGM